MKSLVIGAAIAATCFLGTAIAEEPKQPTLLTDTQMEAITAGVGANNVAIQPWVALTAAGFGLATNDSAATGVAKSSHLESVKVPRKP